MSDSSAVQLLQMVWKHSQSATGHSWLKLNHAMAAALNLAIRSGMEFSVGDFEEIAKRFRSGYWHSPENSYRTAVLYRNSSAYLALENRLGRKPFIVKGASISTHTGDGPCGQGLARLILGAEFVWSRERVTVTSFNDKAQSFVACSYSRTEYDTCEKCGRIAGGGKETILHRFTLRHIDLKVLRPQKVKTNPVASEPIGVVL